MSRTGDVKVGTAKQAPPLRFSSPSFTSPAFPSVFGDILLLMALPLPSMNDSLIDLLIIWRIIMIIFVYHDVVKTQHATTI